jgi:hypothetical protein
MNEANGFAKVEHETSLKMVIIYTIQNTKSITTTTQIKTNKPDIMAMTLLGHGDPLFWATMKDGKPDDFYFDDKMDYASSHWTSSTGQHGDPLFQEVQEHERTTTKKPIHIEFLDDDGMAKWAAGEAMMPMEAMQQMIISDKDMDMDAVVKQPIRTECYGHGDPFMDYVMEASAAGDTMTDQEDFHQVEGQHYLVESKMHGDPLLDAIIKDPSWDKKLAGAIDREVMDKEKAD